jgi:guanylate kinase
MEVGFSNRMVGFYPEVYAEMMKLRRERKDFVTHNDDIGTFYRNQRLITMLRDGEITKDNLSELMTKEKMSEDMIPMYWYYTNGDVDPQKLQMELMIKNMKLSSDKKNERGRVTASRMRTLLHRILLQRVDRYLYPEKYLNNKILCIVGESGTGKTLCSLHLKYKLGANVICSFTTRPPRKTEKEGRDHHFVNIVPDPNDLLAYTVFGSYEYYALKSQVYGDCTVYVVDEKGLETLKSEHGDEYRIFSVYLKRKWANRVRTGIEAKRLHRDKKREQLPLDSYDWVIENNSTKKELFNNIERIYNKVKSK